MRLGELPDSELVARQIATTPRWLVAHRDYLRRLPKGRRAPRIPEDLLQHNCMGIGFSPTWLFEEELAGGAVQHLLPDWESAASPIHLVTPPERRQSAKVRAFAEHAARTLGSERQ